REHADLDPACPQLPQHGYPFLVGERVRFPLAQVAGNQRTRGLDPGALQNAEDRRAAMLGSRQLPQRALGRERCLGAILVVFGVVRLADHAPHLGVVDRVPRSQGPAPVEDDRVNRHPAIISGPRSRLSSLISGLPSWYWQILRKSALLALPVKGS